MFRVKTGMSLSDCLFENSTFAWKQTDKYLTKRLIEFKTGELMEQQNERDNIVPGKELKREYERTN
jgi:hypothetical protein